jgi:hypothetical protein
LNYRSGDCGAGCNVYMNVSLNATWSGLTTDRGAGGVYFISFQSRIQGVGGLTGGATGILTLAKGYNQGWTVGFNEIASSGGVHITMNTVTNSVTSLKLNFVDNNFSPAEKFVSVVQLGPYDNYAGGVGPLTWQAHEY